MIFKLGELERGRRWANPRKEIRKPPEGVRNDVQDELRGQAQLSVIESHANSE